MGISSFVPGELGFGTAPLGNMYRDIGEEEAAATAEAAWDRGIRYFDTAPFYGAGLSEIRLGSVLAGKPRADYVLSTKVGRVIGEEPTTAPQQGEGLFAHGRPNEVVDDYTESGTLRSIEESLRRLRTDRLDIVWVHDIAQDFHGDDWIKAFETARTGAFRALTRLREEGVIRAWGLGVNRTEPCELTLDLDEPRPDAFLLAGRYTLLDHSHALQRLMPAAREQGVDIVAGGPYNSGALVGGDHFEYAPAPQEIRDRVRRLTELADEHGAGIKAAGLQFALAHPAVASVIPGSSRPSRIDEDLDAVDARIPDAFWQALVEEGHIDPAAPLPG